MPSTEQTAKIMCKGGLDAGNNFLEMSESTPGMATSLINFEWGLSGGYRKINGYTPLLPDFELVDPDNAEGKTYVVCMYKNIVITAKKQIGSNTYKYYFTDFTDEWAPMTTGYTFNSVGVNKIRFAQYNFNGTDKVIFVDGVNPAVIYDGTTWAQVLVGPTVSDSFVGGDQALPAPSLVTVFKNTIFVSGDESAPNVIAHSGTLKDTKWSFSQGGAGQVIAGFPVVQIRPYREECFVFGDLDIKKIVISGTEFVIQDVTKDIGCVAADSVVEINGDLLFLSQDGFRPISSTERIGDIELGSVSKPIQTILKDRMRSASLDQLDAVVIRGKSQVRFFFNSDAGSSSLNRGIIGCIYPGGQGDAWMWGELLGIRTSCTTSGYKNGVEYIIHGDYNGGVYIQETGSSFNGANIQTVYATPYLDFGETQVRKTMTKLNIFMKPEGTVELTAGINYDWSMPNTINPSAYVGLNQGNFEYYGTAIYNKAKYGGKVFPVMTMDIQGSGFSMMTVLTTDDKLAPFTIQGLIYEFSVNGRD